MIDSYVIRAAVNKDKQAIADIYVNSWKFAYKGIISQDYLDSLSVERYLERMKDMEKPDEFVFELDGKVVGLAKLIDCRDRNARGSAEIQTIYFLPGYTGRGYGVILLEWLKDKALSMGYPDMVIWVLTDNSRARRAYEKAGFSKDRSRLVTIAGKDLRESRYTVALTATGT